MLENPSEAFTTKMKQPSSKKVPNSAFLCKKYLVMLLLDQKLTLQRLQFRLVVALFIDFPNPSQHKAVFRNFNTY